MPKAIIYAFSGTGNTLYAANVIANTLKENGYEVSVESIKREAKEIPNPVDCDLVAFGYPIHAFNCPQIAIKYARKLPKVNGIKTIIFKTSGEPFGLNNASSFNLYAILKRKGYKVTSDTHLLMPYNIMFRYRDSLVKQMYYHTEAMGKLIVAKALNGEEKRILYNPLTILWALILRLQWLGAWINGPMISAKKDKCIKCEKCVKECPAGNIKIVDGKVKVGWHCTMCMHCAMYCPKDAIRPGFLTPWKVNGAYDFKKFITDDSIANRYVKDDTKGYFKLFSKYYRKTYAEIDKYGIELSESK